MFVDCEMNKPCVFLWIHALSYHCLPGKVLNASNPQTVFNQWLLFSSSSCTRDFSSSCCTKRGKRWRQNRTSATLLLRSQKLSPSVATCTGASMTYWWSSIRLVQHIFATSFRFSALHSIFSLLSHPPPHPVLQTNFANFLFPLLLLFLRLHLLLPQTAESLEILIKFPTVPIPRSSKIGGFFSSANPHIAFSAYTCSGPFSQPAPYRRG